MDPSPSPQPSPQVQACQMTPQLAGELCELLREPKREVKYATMNAILQHTKSEEGKLMFQSTTVFQDLISAMKDKQLQKLCLSTLIHFSSNQKCSQKLLPYLRVLVMDLRDSEGLVEELGLLLLLNLSKLYEFTNQLILEKGQTTESSGIILGILGTMLDKKVARRWVIANVFVNISSHDVGREYIAREGLYLKFLDYINDQKQALRLASLRIIRNISFLWEQEDIITQILNNSHNLINKISIHILIMILKSQLCSSFEQAIDILKSEQYSSIVNYEGQILGGVSKMVTTKERSISEIELCVDIIIILSNADFPKRKPEFWMDGLKRMIGLVNFTQISEEAKDKLEALETFCFW